MNQDKIKEEAKRIMDDFLSELGERPVTEEFGIERKDAIRVPIAREPDPKFKERILRNAPKVDADCIIAEKKSW